ncbi:MAG TPA: DUF3108 domain-containing protein [Thermoanaerobaculia bacterium]
MKTLLAILAAAAVLNSTPSSPIEQTFLNGETLDYTVTWMKVTGGTARMTIAPIDDATRYRVTSVVRSGGSIARLFKVRDEIESIVDRADFSTLRYTKRLDERGDKELEITTITDGVASRKRERVRRLLVPRPVLDPFSVIYHCRTLDLSPGKVYEFTLLSDMKLYNVHARVVRREQIQTPAGQFNTVMVEPQMASGGVAREERLFIWYSDDERRLPVRIRTEVKFGSITATLKNVQSGVTSIDPPPLPK